MLPSPGLGLLSRFCCTQKTRLMRNRSFETPKRRPYKLKGLGFEGPMKRQKWLQSHFMITSDSPVNDSYPHTALATLRLGMCTSIRIWFLIAARSFGGGAGRWQACYSLVCMVTLCAELSVLKPKQAIGHNVDNSAHVRELLLSRKESGIDKAQIGTSGSKFYS